MPDDPVRQKRYRELTRKHLDGLMHSLFAEFTGLHFHVIWAPMLPGDWSTTTLPTVCPVGARLATTGEVGHCRTCRQKRLPQTLRSTSTGHRFTCRRGVRNHWLPVIVRGVPVGVAYLQAPADGASGEAVPPGRRKSKVVTRSDFLRAGRLLRLLVRYAQTLDLAELRQADLAAARRAITALEKEQTRLRRALGQILGTGARSPAADGPESHAEQVAHAALAIVRQQYSRPLTLGECARELGLNAAYLSALFSRTVGMPFKAYLTELRIQKAKQLLGDPSRQVCEVAGAVGYASENRFRIAFRQATGCSPRLWRKTFRFVA